MKRKSFFSPAAPVAVAAVIALAACSGGGEAAAPIASVKNDGLAGITSWQPPTQVCGSANLMPVLFYNGTDAAQTASMTIGGDLTEQVIPSSGTGDYQEYCPERTGTGRWNQTKPGFSGDQTVQPGETYQFYLYLGGADYNLIEAGNQFSIGGVPSGAAGASWYDLDLSLNPEGSFSKLATVYQGTGGIDWATNNQNGFNIVECDPNVFPAPGSGQPMPAGFQVDTNTLLTPYDSAVMNGPSYTWWQPLCFAWFPNSLNATDPGEILEDNVNGDVANDPNYSNPLPSSEQSEEEVLIRNFLFP